MGSCKSECHALIFPYPFIGHINPMMELALKLASKGMLVTFANILSHHNRIISNYQNDKPTLHHPQEEEEEAEAEAEGGFQLFSSGLPPNIRLVGLSDGLPLDFDRDSDMFAVHNASMNMNGVLTRLLAHLERQGEAVTCFVADSFVPWTESVARHVAIPWVSVWTQATTVFSIYYSTFLASNEQDKDVPPLEVLATVNSIYDSPSMEIADLPTFVQVMDPTEHFICILRNVFRSFLKADYILGTSFYHLEPNAQDFMTTIMHIPIHTVGPLLPQSNFEYGKREVLRASTRKEEMHCLQWLDGHALESVLFVSFGSMAPLSKQQAHEIAHGLEASGNPFLWVIRGLGDKCQDLPNGFIERISDRGLLISWAPQLQVLAHPSIGGFLTHCGWNSSIESIAIGVPMLGMPYFSDQTTNCKLMADHWKIGLRVHKEVIENDQLASSFRTVLGVASREEVERKVRILMQEEEGKVMRRRAKYLSKEAKAAIAPDGTSEKALQAFVLEMRKLACITLSHKVI